MSGNDKKKHIKENLKRHKWDIHNWAKLDYDMIYSYAFNTLSAITIIVLIRFLQKRKYHKKKRNRGACEYENKGLVFTYSEAEAFGISPKSFSRAIQDLVRKGFLQIDHTGGSFNGRDYSSYSLIEDWKNYGTGSFKPREKKAVIQYNESLKKHNLKKACKINDPSPINDANKQLKPIMKDKTEREKMNHSEMSEEELEVRKWFFNEDR